MKLFPLGSVVCSVGATEAIEQAGQSPQEFLDRHIEGDWGEMPLDYWEENNRALICGGRLLSAHKTAKGRTIWVFTESDRSTTVVFLPEEEQLDGLEEP